MKDNTIRMRLLEATAEANTYCALLQDCREMEKEEFIERLTMVLPKIYLFFADSELARQAEVQEGSEEEEPDPDMPIDLEMAGTEFFRSYVDEDHYESIRRNAERMLGADDVFLETFEEDMKYSDTPIAASISEGLADIFQPLFNFVSAVRESEAEVLEEAFLNCREEFATYWAQTLCNILRPLNHLRFGR